jgi:sec-independent protein translocase protein TatA
MFGIGGSELIFTLLIVVMLFGSEKIPEIARALGKIMRQVKDATNDIKSEITNSADMNGIDLKSIKNNFTGEIENVKQGINKMISENATGNDPLNIKSITEDINTEINKAKVNINDLTDGPIKRQ